MTKLRIGPAMRYQIDYMLWASLSILGIIIGIMLILSIFVAGAVAAGDEGLGAVVIMGFLNVGDGLVNMSFNVASVLTITFFIFGVGGIREDFKFFLQHGMGRTTTYLSVIFISLLSGAAWGLICQILTVISNNWAAFPATGMGFPDSNFIVGWLLHTLSFFFAWQLGTVISLIYYRLGKTQKVIFSVAAIALIVFVIPNSISYLVNFFISGDIGEYRTAFVSFFENPLSLTLIVLAFGVICALANFLLLRRAQARE